MRRAIVLSIILIVSIVVVKFLQRDQLQGEDGYRFSDTNSQMLFISMLKKRGIGYREDDEGYVWYMKKHDDEVSKIKSEIIKRNYSSKYSITFHDVRLFNNFTEELKRNNIKFRVIKQDNTDWIHWGPEDDLKVKEIKKKQDSQVLKILGLPG